MPKVNKSIGVRTICNYHLGVPPAIRFHFYLIPLLSKLPRVWLTLVKSFRADFNKMLLCAHVHEFLFKLKLRTKRGVGKSTGSLHCVEKGNEVAIISSVWLVSCKNIIFIFHLLHPDYRFIDQFSTK